MWRHAQATMRRSNCRCLNGTAAGSPDRSIASLGIFPAVDPLDSTSRVLSPDVVGQTGSVWSSSAVAVRTE